ncbi:MAG: DoxX family protein [Geodermatophilaceae bacterium]|nr:DoxX family protein [Geodermatophilaceae bacterium]
MSHDLDVTPDATQRRSDPTVDVGLLILRVFVGLAIAAHGAQKLFGAFGGAGIEGTGQFFESVGYSPGTTFAVIGGLTELGGGLLLALGLAAPLAAAAIVGTLTGAYSVVQAAGDADFFGGAGGPELELFYVVAAFALILTGPGRHALRIAKLDTPLIRSIALVLAVAGGAAAILLRG